MYLSVGHEGSQGNEKVASRFTSNRTRRPYLSDMVTIRRLRVREKLLFATDVTTTNLCNFNLSLTSVRGKDNSLCLVKENGELTHIKIPCIRD